MRIFIKGPKNAHTLATKVYEKGPQSLADAIREVEKLQAAQQLTSTLLSPSLVNTMSSDNDKHFQCQETGHMVCYCPQTRCFDCDNYGHIAADCPNKIPPSGTTTLVDMIDQHLGVTITPGITTVTIKIGTGSADLDLAAIILDIGVTIAVTITEVTLDPFTVPHATAHHATEA